MRLSFCCCGFLFWLVISACQSGSAPANPDSPVVTTDLANFWRAYDQIQTTDDSARQAQYLQELFIEPGSPGLAAMREARRYTVGEYLQAIERYPRFWEAMRPRMATVAARSGELEAGIEALRQLYPELKPARIYFTVGALRSNGTTLEDKVLIGAELALAGPELPTEELKEDLPHLEAFFASDPGRNLTFLNVHEYVHTQQATTLGETLLAQTMIEGVAEFLAVLALDQPSPNPQIAFGRAHDDGIRAAFEGEMWSPLVYNWLWNSPDNAFGMRDLAYYLGFAICERYYEQAADKAQAVRDLIHLAYNDTAALAALVDQSGYFPQPVASYRSLFEAARPKVVGYSGLQPGDTLVDPDLASFRVHFSQPMNPNFIATDLGSLGREHFPRIRQVALSSDQQSAIYDIALESSTDYELVLHWGYRDTAGLALRPDTLRFRTGE